MKKIIASWEIKNEEFQKGLDSFEDTLPGLLEKNLGDVSKGQRELLACLVIEAFESLRSAIHNRSESAVKLVLQLSGLMKDQSKLPKPPKAPPSPGVSESSIAESLQE